MGAATTRFGDITPRTAVFSAAGFLKRGQPRLLTERFGQPKPIPKKHSKVIKFRRYEALATVEAPLAEGVPPTGQKLTATDYTATLEQFGDFTEITDVIMDTHEDNVLQEGIKTVSEQAAQTIELVRLATLKAGTNVYYAGTGTTRATVDAAPARKDFRKIVRGLNRYNANTIESIVKASPKIDTEPVNPSFFGICHTDLKPDLRGVTSFIEVKNYADSDKSIAGEFGSIEDVRLCCSTMVKPWLAQTTDSSVTYLSNGSEVTTAGASDVYPILVFAQDAYGIVPLQGKNAVKLMVINPDMPSKGDELGQKGFVSWKMYQACVILNQNWMARLEALVVAEPT
ncbi:MAG: N4-gp56 family major capsid protein [PVC group bacterium]|nr:N4-gp56 family major capsid protein [PVC group bacterium]